ncbi:MAG: TIM barrel protein [Proteobacteria bacterium]|nr:TIM barrel protein [Pseudomonadota bacterium]
MPKLAANLSLLFPDLEFARRFEAAARAGFRRVEYQFPYEWPAADVARWAREANVEVVLHNLPAGDFAAGERGLASLPGRESEFRDGVARAIEYAAAVGCTRLNCLAGIASPGAPRQGLLETVAQNLAFASRQLETAGIALMVEACNTRTIPGFFLHSSAQVLEAIDFAGAGNAWLQYDIFHMQIMEGDLARSIERLLPRIGHLQIADVPDRHEPGTGEINFPWLLGHIDRIGYAGTIGCEYVPAGDTVAGLGWAKPWLGA